MHDPLNETPLHLVHAAPHAELATQTPPMHV